MPYIDGKRVTNEEWTRTYGSLKMLHTSARGENPAPPPELDAATGAPKSRQTRSQRSTTGVKAAVAGALGVKPDSVELEDIDVTGLDAEPVVTATEETEATEADAPAVEETAPEAPAADPLACDVEGCDMVAKTTLGLASHKRAKHKDIA